MTEKNRDLLDKFIMIVMIVSAFIFLDKFTNLLIYNNFMKKPKYQIGDKVWVIDNNKIGETVITAIGLVKNEFRYSFCQLEGSAVSLYCPEERLFATKEDLIASL